MAWPWAHSFDPHRWPHPTAVTHGGYTDFCKLKLLVGKHLSLHPLQRASREPPPPPPTGPFLPHLPCMFHLDASGPGQGLQSDEWSQVWAKCQSQWGQIQEEGTNGDRVPAVPPTECPYFPTFHSITTSPHPVLCGREHHTYWERKTWELEQLKNVLKVMTTPNFVFKEL